MTIQSNMPAWAANYIGIPYKAYGYDREGCNCWGIVRMVLMEQFNIQLARHDEVQFWDKSLADETSRRMAKQIREYTADEWSVVDKYKMVAGDILLLRVLGRPVHTGVAISRTHMIHVQDNAASVCESIFSLAWERRVISVFRHKSRLTC